MASLIDRMREAFGVAQEQASTRGAMPDKPEESVIADDSVFADDDEAPITDKYGDFYALYTPFSWKTNKGKQRFGFIIKGVNDGRIYGLETDDGSCMPASSVKKMMYRMVNDGKSSFSKPGYIGLRDYNPELKVRFSLYPDGRGRSAE